MHHMVAQMVAGQLTELRQLRPEYLRWLSCGYPPPCTAVLEGRRTRPDDCLWFPSLVIRCAVSTHIARPRLANPLQGFKLNHSSKRTGQGRKMITLTYPLVASPFSRPLLVKRLPSGLRRRHRASHMMIGHNVRRLVANAMLVPTLPLEHARKTLEAGDSEFSSCQLGARPLCVGGSGPLI